MANITAAMVKELREASGAGMMDCKKALAACEGDMDAAIDYLRKNGQAKAQKKAGRIAAEGISYVAVSEDGKTAVAVEVNSETDFVAKNEKFQSFVADVADVIMKNDVADIDALFACGWDHSEAATVADALTEQIATIGENMKIRRFCKVVEENGYVASYTHMGGKIGVLIDIETDVVNDAVDEMGKAGIQKVDSAVTLYEVPHVAAVEPRGSLEYPRVSFGIELYLEVARSVVDAELLRGLFGHLRGAALSLFAEG